MTAEKRKSFRKKTKNSSVPYELENMEGIKHRETNVVSLFSVMKIKWHRGSKATCFKFKDTSYLFLDDNISTCRS